MKINYQKGYGWPVLLFTSCTAGLIVFWLIVSFLNAPTSGYADTSHFKGQDVNVLTLQITHELAIQYAATNPSVRGTIPLEILKIPVGFSNTRVNVNINAEGAVRTWTSPTSVPHATRLMTESLGSVGRDIASLGGAGFVLSSGGWSDILLGDLHGTANDTLEVPRDAFVIFTPRMGFGAKNQ
jgi:hypothetical protein